MSINIFALNTKSQSEDVSSLTADELYTSFNTNKSDGFLLGLLKRIANNEYILFLAILDTFFERSEWKGRVNFSFTELPKELVELPEDDYTKMLLGNIDIDDAKILLEMIEILTDIYEKDMETHMFQKVFIITYNNRYYGHVYQENYMSDTDASLIGIRTSIYNILAEKHGFYRFKNIGTILLDAYASFFDGILDKIYITNPIGVMKYIALKFGFDKEFSYDPTNHKTKTTFNLISSEF